MEAIELAMKRIEASIQPIGVPLRGIEGSMQPIGVPLRGIEGSMQPLGVVLRSIELSMQPIGGRTRHTKAFMRPSKPSLPRMNPVTRRARRGTAAERVGFEPTIPFYRYTRFPIVRLRPLGHLSNVPSTA